MTVCAVDVTEGAVDDACQTLAAAVACPGVDHDAHKALRLSLKPKAKAKAKGKAKAKAKAKVQNTPKKKALRALWSMLCAGLSEESTPKRKAAAWRESDPKTPKR